MKDYKKNKTSKAKRTNKKQFDVNNTTNLIQVNKIQELFTFTKYIYLLNIKIDSLKFPSLSSTHLIYMYSVSMLRT